MNIFVTSGSPKAAARALDDRRLVKMVLETAQLLSTAVSVRSRELDRPPPAKIYKETHVNHPCALWARATRANYTWLARHFEALAHEYAHRYMREHASWLCLGPELLSGRAVSLMPTGGLLPFANCTEFKDSASTIGAYRSQLVRKWIGDEAAGRPPRWTMREPPHWKGSEL